MSFKYVPAGVVPSDVNVNMYIKYIDTGEKEIRWTYDKETRVTEIVCPDRLIWLVRYINASNPQFIPEDFDEYISPNIYEKNSVPSAYCDQILFSAHNAKGYAKKDRREWLSNDKLKVFVDSGGFQLRSGSASYVSPFKNIEIYNKSADIAMGLDIPPRPADRGNLEALKMLATAQKKNTEIFKANLCKDRKIKFLNPIQGFSFDEIRQWMAIVDDPLYSGYAIAMSSGKFSDNHFISMTTLLLPFLEGKGRKEQIHCFGVSGKKVFPILAWMGRHVDVTADSSQHIHTSIRAKIFENFVPNGKIAQYRMGDTDLLTEKGRVRINTIDFTNSVEIPCGCNICSRLKYAQLYTLPSTTGMSSLLSVHNMISNIKISSWWDEQAQKAKSVDDFYECLKKVRPKEADHLKEVCKFIDYLVKHGIKKTQKEYEHKLGKKNKLIASDMDTLFGDKIKRKAAMENLDLLDSSVTEFLPNYLDYKELKHLVSKDEYISCKINTLWDDRYENNKKNTMTFDEFSDKVWDDISLKGHEFLKSEIIAKAKRVEKNKDKEKKRKEREQKKNDKVIVKEMKNENTSSSAVSL